MNKFRNLSVGKKMISGFILVAIIALAVGVVGLFGMNQIMDGEKVIANEALPSIENLQTINEATTSVLLGERGLINRRMMETDVRNAQYVFIEDAFKRSNESWNKYADMPKSPREEELWNKLNVQWEEWVSKDEELINLSREKDNMLASGIGIDDQKIVEMDDKIFAVSLESREKWLPVNDTIGELVGEARISSQNVMANGEAIFRSVTVVLIAALLIGFIIAIMLGVFISRMISKPVAELVDISQTIADGDLNVEVKVNSKDEIGKLAEAFKVMTENINETMERINVSSAQVNSGARQISVSSQALAQGSTEQASSIEEITASLEEIAAQTRQNATNASKANELALSTKESAVMGNEKMKDMLQSMDEINQSSNNISKIIKVIDDIAFQTNILALNAAVEAARAGQYGKGFAVVAEEVRNLAARSADAAKETTEMIEGSIRKVEIGTNMANETASSLNQIVDGITQAAELVGEIAQASNEQASGVAQVNDGITQVSQVVQTNSATSQESAAVSEELAGQAELLKQMVARFTLKKSKNSVFGRNIDPDIMKALEDMIENKSNKALTNKKDEEEKEVLASSEINLGDNEFDKY